MSPLILHEYEHWQGVLDREDASYLGMHLSKQLDIFQKPWSTDCSIHCKQYVGVVNLPSGRRVEILPKVPIATLFSMLAIAYDLPDAFRDDLAGYLSFADLFAFVVDYFVEMVQAHIDQGLYRSYIEFEDNLPSVRGRIIFAVDMQCNAILRQNTYCRFGELTWDIPENQIIRQVIHALSGWDFDRSLHSRLHAADISLAEISDTHFSADVIDRFQYHRQNEVYIPTHHFCRLFLDGFSLSERSGEAQFRTFLIDMNELFERFVSQILLRFLAKSLQVKMQKRDSLDIAGIIGIRPDIIITTQDRRAVIADCKYKRDPVPSESDCYQMLAYCTALSARQGILIYPQTEHSSPCTLSIRYSPIRIQTCNIDLSVAGNTLSTTCRDFAKKIYYLISKMD